MSLTLRGKRKWRAANTSGPHMRVAIFFIPILPSTSRQIVTFIFYKNPCHPPVFSSSSRNPTQTLDLQRRGREGGDLDIELPGETSNNNNDNNQTNNNNIGFQTFWSFEFLFFRQIWVVVEVASTVGKKGKRRRRSSDRAPAPLAAAMDARFPYSPAETASVRTVQFGILGPDEIVI